MTTMRTHMLAAFVAVSLVGRFAFAVVQENGTHLGIEGKEMNGKEMNGTALNGVTLNGLTLNGKEMNGVTLAGGLQLTGTRLHGTFMDQPMCGHLQGATGDPLPASCNACAATVCAADAHCCATAWDGTCVSEAQTMCSIDATQLVGGNSEMVATVNMTDGSKQTMRLHIKAMR
jgi:hypothetical protein